MTTWYSKAERKLNQKVNPATIASLALTALSVAAMVGVQVALR